MYNNVKVFCLLQEAPVLTVNRFRSYFLKPSFKACSNEQCLKKQKIDPLFGRLFSNVGFLTLSLPYKIY